MNLKMAAFKHKILPFTALTLLVLQAVLVLISWIIASVYPSLHVRSMLSSEGIRWFLGNFTVNMMTPLLVWLLLGFIAWGALLHSGLYSALRNIRRISHFSYRQRHALRLVSVVSVVFVFLVILLAFIPHAILLGVYGGLFPSAFSKGLVPLLAFFITSLSVVYGIDSGIFTCINQVFRALYAGLLLSAPVWPIYILTLQLYCSVIYVFF